MKKPLLVASLLLALACTRKPEATETSAASSPKKKLDVVTFNMNPTLSYAPMMIAIDEGYFEREGIDARFVSLDSNSAVAAGASGKIDVLSAGVRSGVFNMMLRGVPLQIVADKGHSTRECAAEAFVAPKDVAKRIAENGGSLKGERVAMTRGGIMEFLTHRLIASRGNRLEDVTFVQLPHGSAPSARDRVDAVRLLTEPNLTAVQHDGWATIVATSEQVAPQHQNSVLIFGKRLLQDDPELGNRVMRAWLRGVRQLEQGKTPRNVAILAKHTKLPEEMIRGGCNLTFDRNGRIDPAAVQPFLDWALQQKYLDAPIEVNRWWNPAVAQRAARELDQEAR